MRFFQTIVCLLAFFLLAGCEGSFSVSTAGLSEPVLATSVDEKTQAPVEKVENISPETKTIYATIKVSYAPADTRVKAVFFYTDAEEQQIAEHTVTAQGTQYISFSLTPPANGWPVGNYRVQFYLNDAPKEQLAFKALAPVAANEKAVEPPIAAPTEQEQQKITDDAMEYKRLADGHFGFSFEVPGNWNWNVIPNTKDYLLSGPADTDAGEITVIIQIIDTRLGGVGSLKEQMLDLVGQFSALPGSSIVKKDQFEVAGQVAPFFIATYEAQNSTGQQVSFGHTQLGIDHPPYLLLISYAAPKDIYQGELATFQHLMDTFILQDPEL